MGGPSTNESDFVHAAISSLDTDDILRRLGELLLCTVPHEWARICLRPQQDDRLLVWAVIWDGQPALAPGDTLSLNGSLAGSALLSGQPVIRGDLSRDGINADERLLAAERGVRSFLAVPLSAGGRVIGTLELGGARPDSFGEAEVKQVQAIADQVATVVSHAWLLEESKELAKIKERRRLAWEVHDTVIQSLISLVLQIELAERCLRTDLQKAAVEISRAWELSRECLEDARRLVLNLKPPFLERSSLDQALAREMETLESTGIQVRFSVTGSPVNLPSEAEMAVYRIAQEACANVRKHARASRIIATLDYGPEQVRLTIADNGIGFQPASVPEAGGSGHFGLAGARQRAQAAGGVVHIESAPGRGATLLVEFPIAGRAASEVPHGDDERRRGDAPIRVLLVDDHPLVRHGLREILGHSPEIEVAGEAGDAGDALEMIRSLQPDVVVVDVQLPGMSGIELIEATKRLALGTRSLVLSAHRGGDLVLRAVQAGAQGYLLKDTAGSTLVDAIHAIQRGEMVLSPPVSDDLSSALGNRQPAPERLTEREVEVLGMIAQGLRNKEIARKLSLTEATIKYHVAHLLDKLGTQSRTEALVKAQGLGLLPGQQYSTL